MRVNYPWAGETEQDPREFYTISCQLIRKCFRKSQMNTKGVAGICTDNQMKIRAAVFYGVNNPTAKLWGIIENTGVLR